MTWPSHNPCITSRRHPKVLSGTQRKTTSAAQRPERGGPPHSPRIGTQLCIASRRDSLSPLLHCARAHRVPHNNFAVTGFDGNDADVWGARPSSVRHVSDGVPDNLPHQRPARLKFVQQLDPRRHHRIGAQAFAFLGSGLMVHRRWRRSSARRRGGSACRESRSSAGVSTLVTD